MTDGSWIVWDEASHQPDFANWVVRTANWRTGAFRQLAQASTVSGEPGVGIQPLLALDHGTLLWSQMIGPVNPNDPSTTKNEEVALADLNAGTVATLATSAYGAALSLPWAVWGAIVGGGDQGYDVLKNLETGQTARLNITPASLSLHGLTAVLSVDDKAVDLVPNVLQSQTPQPLISTPTPVLQSPTIGDRLVAWSQTSGQPLPHTWDLTEHVLVTLPTTSAQSYVAWTGGHTLVWLDPESSAQQQADQQQGLVSTYTICVIDTRTLPTTPTT